MRLMNVFLCNWQWDLTKSMRDLDQHFLGYSMWTWEWEEAVELD